MRLVEAEELSSLLPMSAAIDALQDAFATQDPSGGRPRSRVETPAGTLLLMPAASDVGVGVKLVTLTPDNPEAGLPLIHAVYVLFDLQTQAPSAVIDGAALTALRTAAVSGLATRWMAREESPRLLIFGSGVQARAHLDAMRAVREISAVTVVSRTGSHAAAFADDIREMDLHARVGTAADVETADIICTCTAGETPLFDGKMLRAGTHINAIGSFLPETRELDSETMKRARVVVETREAVVGEAGELVIPIGEGVFAADHVIADLAEVVRGAEVRQDDADITVFKSVGLAFEDLVIARAAVT
jgi:ornithine cyclodeaminase/alanine dehydrogenase-like protein (mu-crystallin family)